MFLLIVQLFRVEYKEDVLLAMTSCGIRKGCTFEGYNLDKALERDYPLFSGLIKSQDEKDRYSMMITAVVEKLKKARDLVHLLKEADIDIEKEEILRLIALPIAYVVDNETHWENRHDQG